MTIIVNVVYFATLSLMIVMTIWLRSASIEIRKLTEFIKQMNNTKHVHQQKFEDQIEQDLLHRLNEFRSTKFSSQRSKNK